MNYDFRDNLYYFDYNFEINKKKINNSNKNNNLILSIKIIIINCLLNEIFINIIIFL